MFIGECAQINVLKSVNVLLNNLWPIVMFFMYELQTVKTCSNYFEISLIGHWQFSCCLTETAISWSHRLVSKVWLCYNRFDFIMAVL